MLWFSFCLFGMVSAADDSPNSCDKSPDAAKCVGDFVWSPTAQHCECLSHFPLFEFVEAPSQTSDGRQLQRSTSRYHFDNCYRGQQPGKNKILTMGIFMDLGAYNRAGGDEGSARNKINTFVDFTNDIFTEQLDIRVRVDELFLAYPGHSIPGSRQSDTRWMDDVPNWRNLNKCANSGITRGSTRLNAFRSWVYKNFGNKYALWHLLTVCRSEAKFHDNTWGPTGGLAARVGGFCTSMGAAYTVYSRSEYFTRVTFAHEVGHNMGASHTFERLRLTKGTKKGLMDYGDSTYEGVVQFHPRHAQYMCPAIERSMNAQNCWKEEHGSGSTPGKKTTGRPSGKTLTTTKTPSSKGNLKDTSKNCKRYANEVSCAKKGSLESIRCQKTCAAWLGRDTGKIITGSGGSSGGSGGTGSSGKGSANCNDQYGAVCTTWISVCKTNSIVRSYCRKTCGMCGDGQVRSAQTQEGKGADTTLLTMGIFCGVALVLALLIGVAVFLARKKRETVETRAPESTADAFHITTRRE
eukprot:GEMP01015729.1.p1 GENE.GEMP01015729.1~~GEMP01015729.1.p1  ORF type:complete len:522 (+),score=59.31 GEMP01015729.1:613-2178(+)